MAEPRWVRALREAPRPADCPWLRVELPAGVARGPVVFALAIHDGIVVASAPVARKTLGWDVRAAWRYFAARGAHLRRIG